MTSSNASNARAHKPYGHLKRFFPIYITCVILGALAYLDYYYVMTNYARHVEKERVDLLEKAHRKASSAIAAADLKVRSVEALARASQSLEADELTNFSQSLVNGLSLGVAEFGIVELNQHGTGLIKRGNSNARTFPLSTLSLDVRDRLSNLESGVASRSYLLPGKLISDAREETSSFITLLKPYQKIATSSGADGVIFLSLNIDRIATQVDRLNGVRVNSISVDTTGRKQVYEFGSGAGQSEKEGRLTLFFDGHAITLLAATTSTDLKTFILDEELRLHLILLGIAFAIIFTSYISVRQIRLSRQAINAAEAANYQKSRFLATMSHEMRTPLNGILGMSDLLRNERLSPMQTRYLDTLNVSAESLLALINETLDLSKIEAGEMELDPQEANLGELINSVSSAANILANGKNIDLITILPLQAYGPFVFDELRLRQVLTNLLSNAIKFTEAGEVVLRVEVIDHRDRNRKEVSFAVIDTGIGIDEDRIKDVFEPFRQADASTTRRYGGTGLGLTISSQIVQAMGGELSVISTPGEGSMFRFTVELDARHNGKPFRRECCVVGLQNIVLCLEDCSLASAAISSISSAGGDIRHIHDIESAKKYILEAERRGDPVDLLLVSNVETAEQFRDHRDVRPNGAVPMKIGLMRSSRLASNVLSSEEQSAADFVINAPHSAKNFVEAIASAFHHRSFEAKSKAKASESSATFTKARVLLVDDDAINLMYGEELLRRLGCQIVTARNGQEAIDRFAEGQSFDIVFLDCQMPVLDGYEAVSILKAKMETEEFSRTPIVALTANAMKQDRLKCFNAGMDDFLSKPVREQEVVEILAKWIGQKGAEPRVPVPNKPQVIEDAKSHAAVAEVPTEVAEDQVVAPLADDLKMAPPKAAKTPDRAAADKIAPERDQSKQAKPVKDVAAKKPLPVVEKEILLKTKATMGPQFPKLWEMFVSQTPNTFDTMRQAIVDQDIELLGRSAHTLKSSAKMMGATAMASVAARIEAQCKSQDASPGDAIALLEELESSFATYISVLRKAQKAKLAS
ncbi:ATP-binding protein [Amaricoccus macauensis]|uniref:hybrid sensor histidine kinase/response regulator n=1 Tax=Amaricoccus macauensis TaxID=57001 RepID=UPI003C7C7EDE